MAAKDKKPNIGFESVRLKSVYEVLDGISWLDESGLKEISQFSGIEPRSAGKVIKNCSQLGIIKEVSKDFYSLTVAYPYKGSTEQKRPL